MSKYGCGYSWNGRSVSSNRIHWESIGSILTIQWTNPINIKLLFSHHNGFDSMIIIHSLKFIESKFMKNLNSLS